MHHRVATCWVAALLACPAAASGQTPPPAAPPPLATQAPSTTRNAWPVLTVPSAADPAQRKPAATGFWLPFETLPRDVVRFFSTDALTVLGVGGAVALAAHRWDAHWIGRSQRLRPSLFTAGNVGGSLLVQAGASVGVYTVARVSGSTRLAAVGRDLLRAQMLAQVIAQAGKFATHRRRPDASDHYSLPSGHTANAFATATVLRQHFGWKAGIPAYTFGTYVGLARMSANKHHLSDVLLGAAVGIAAGRTVTVGAGRVHFDIGVVPAPGGAVITFRTR